MGMEESYTEKSMEGKIDVIVITRKCLVSITVCNLPRYAGVSGVFQRIPDFQRGNLPVDKSQTGCSAFIDAVERSTGAVLKNFARQHCDCLAIMHLTSSIVS